MSASNCEGSIVSKVHYERTNRDRNRWEEVPEQMRRPNKAKLKTCLCCEKEFKGSGSFCSDRCRKEF